MLKSNIIYCGQAAVLRCDGLCDLAWGLNWTGNKIGKAPVDPGTYEGGHAKPTDKKHNKWCARECERSLLSRI